ncbi:Na+/H+ antiporter subunit E [Cellulomonas sp. PhB143]|uniref:Na+/H+ antiporter subunit E n=1 Tax=Cellulomonas sp. PhB143 TaxID=2485186 RepID=UPI000F9B5351|nr:Na+/H+ antiporter subunit E [Cellulomonas sp. PhB143]ROS76468.1 multisubunit sodium/proton antiporter MrpE subunit [Cellulomonas sp. PhB143]
MSRGYWRRWRGRLRTQWHAALWLALVWVLLWGTLAWGTVLVGVLLGLAVVSFAALPSIDYQGTFRPVAFCRLFGRFVVDLVVASAQVAVQALRLRWVPHGAVVRVPMRDAGDLYLTIASILTSLVPGTVIVEAHRLTGVLYVHVLDLESAGGPDEVRRHIHELEARVLRAFASERELARAGLGPAGLAGAGDEARAATSCDTPEDPHGPQDPQDPTDGRAR